MKKLLLATGIFLSIGLTASAQEKKAAVKTVTPATTTLPAPTQMRKKGNKMVTTNQAKIARKVAIENGTAKKAPVATPAKETKDTPVN